MAAPYVVASQALTLAGTSGDAPTAPSSFLARDEPTLMWRSSGLSGVYVIVQATGPADTVALLFSNLRATDTVQVRAGTTAANTSGSPTWDSGALPAYAGGKAAGFRTKTIVAMPAAQAGPFWRIDVNAPSHPDGYVTAARVLVGTRVELPIDWDCKQGVSDPSVVTSGPGWTDVQGFAPLPTWEWTNSWISDDAWSNQVYPFLMAVGNRTPILCVPDVTSGRVQNQAIYGRVTTGPLNGQSSAVNAWAVTLAVTGLTS